jgi:hypothetical protein
MFYTLHNYFSESAALACHGTDSGFISSQLGNAYHPPSMVLTISAFCL